MNGRRDMDCRAFEALLDDLLAGGLAADVLDRAEAHLAGCAECSALLDIALLNQGALIGGEVVDQTDAILARTSGGACGRARQLLPDHVDGLLPEPDRDLVDGHLAHCPDCAELAAVLAWTAPVLLELARLEPDPGFSDAVLAATTALKAPRVTWRRRAADLEDRLRGWWDRVSARPRFSFEAAYVGTLIIVALFATPISPLKDAPPRALELIQAGPALAWGDSVLMHDTLPGRALGLGQAAWRGVGRAQDQVDAVVTSRRERARPAMASARDNLRDAGRAARGGDLVLALSHMSSLRRDLARAWRLWWDGAPESSAPS